MTRACTGAEIYPLHYDYASLGKPAFPLERAHRDRGNVAFRSADFTLLSDGNDELFISNQALARRFWSSDNYTDQTNLVPLQDQLIAVTKSAIMQIFKLEKGQVQVLVDTQTIAEDDVTKDHKRQYYLVKPCWTLLDFWVAYASRMKAPLAHADHAEMKLVMAACKLPADFPIPTPAHRSMIEKLDELGTTHSLEMRPFRPFSRKHRNDQARRIRAEMAVQARHHYRPDAAPLDHNLLRDEFPEFSHVPQTCLDQDRGLRWPPPSVKLLRRAYSLRYIRLPAILLCFVQAAGLPNARDPTDLIRTMEKIDAAFDAVAPGGSYQNPKDIGRVIAHLITGEGDEHSIRRRAQSLRPLRKAFGLLETWIANVGKERFHRFRPANPFGTMQAAHSGLSDVPRISAKIAKEAQLVTRTKRKLRSDYLRDSLVLVAQTARFRAESICSLGAATRRAIEIMGDGERINFSTYEPVLSHTGFLSPGHQRNDWALWRRSALEAEYPRSRSKPLGDDDDDDDLIDTGELLDPIISPLSGDFQLEFLGSHSERGGLCREPWFVPMFRCGAFNGASHLSPAVQAERHRLLIDWRIPSYPDVPAGLLRNGNIGHLHVRAIQDERVLIPVFQFEMAMRFAYLGVQAVLLTACRSGEFRQILHSQKRWSIVTIDGENRFAFRAYRKSDSGDEPPRLETLEVSETFFTDCFATVELIAKLCPAQAEGGSIRDVAPPSGYDGLNPPGPYVFSWNGKLLNAYQLNIFLQVLTANLGEWFQFHDFRHAVAGAASDMGMTQEQLMDLLGHSDVSTTKYYAGSSPDLIDIEVQRAILFRRQICTEHDLHVRALELARMEEHEEAA